MKKAVPDVKGVKNMNSFGMPRKLSQEEHIKTKQMWRDIFADESESFLNYYYSEKIKDNEIYVIEDGDKIVSMIHLNPYNVRVGKEQYRLHYIVGVATDPAYRKKGLMAKLLNYTMDLMAERGEPFTYLMPVAKEIYEPFGFEFVCTRKIEQIRGVENKNNPPEVFKATEKECEEVAEFANVFLEKYEVATIRNEAYYRRMLLEFGSEKGGILIAKRDGKIVGVMNYAKGESYEVNEFLFQSDLDFKHCLYSLTGNESEGVFCKVDGGEEKNPSIMAKVLRDDFAMNLKCAKVFINEWV